MKPKKAAASMFAHRFTLRGRNQVSATIEIGTATITPPSRNIASVTSMPL